jgi:hypothetical protein
MANGQYKSRLPPIALITMFVLINELYVFINSFVDNHRRFHNRS